MKNVVSWKIIWNVKSPLLLNWEWENFFAGGGLYSIQGPKIFQTIRKKCSVFWIVVRTGIKISLFFYFTIFRIFERYLRSTALKFSIEILKRNFEKTFKRFFQKLFQIIYRGTSKSRIFFWVTNHLKIYQSSQNLAMFLQ